MITVSKRIISKRFTRLRARESRSSRYSGALAQGVAASSDHALRRLKKDGLVRVQSDGHVHSLRCWTADRAQTHAAAPFDRAHAERDVSAWSGGRCTTKRTIGTCGYRPTLRRSCWPDGKRGACPHGNLSEVERPASRRRRGLVLLAEASPGKTYRVSGIYERDRDLLEFLEARGIRPGAKLSLIERELRQDALHKTGPRTMVLGRPAADRVWVFSSFVIVVLLTTINLMMYTPVDSRVTSNQP